MPRPKVFVSFSSKDIQFIRRLFFRMHAQPLELWDYSQEGQEIRGGRDINEYLRERIAACDVFIPIVSANSFLAQWAPREVEHALALVKNGAALRIIPIAAAECLPLVEWPAPYDALKNIRYYAITALAAKRDERLKARANLENVLGELCRDLGVDYATLPFEDPRLPFMDRFDVELHSLENSRHFFRHTEHHIAIYRRLLEARNELEEAIALGDYEAALTRISYFTATCEYEITGAQFYYAYLVRAICLISGGRLSEAYELLTGLLKHPKRDDNVFGALGAVRQRQGAYAAALKYYQEAAALDANDPAAKYGILLNGLLSGARGGEDRLIAEIEKARSLVSEDQTKVQALKAFTYGVLGRPHNAIQVYEQMIAQGQVSAAILVNFAHVLSNPDVGQVERAYRLLEQHRAEFGNDPDFLHRLATLAFTCGLQQQSLREFEQLVRLHPSVRQFRIDAAQAYWRRGDRQHARQLAESILDRNRFTLPATPNDFFCDGFANWFLGRHANADYDFQRSGFPANQHYRFLIE